MLKLLINEWVKYFNRLSTYIMLGLIVLLFLLISVLTHLNQPDFNDQKTYGTDWKQEVKADIKDMKQKLQKLQTESSDDLDVDHMVAMSVYEQEIPRLEFYLKKDVQPPASNNVFENILMTSQFSNLITIMVVVIAGSLMSKEFQQGTIKLLLIRPASRVKIYFSKWLLTVISSLLFLIFTYAVSTIFALFQAKLNRGAQLAIFDFTDGKFHMVNFWQYLSKLMFGDFIFILTIATIAYVLSVVTKNTAAAQGISLALLFFSGLITSYIAGKTDFVKYLWPANWNLNQYLFTGAKPPIEHMNYAFSLSYDVIALVIVLILGAYIFNRRDVAN